MLQPEQVFQHVTPPRNFSYEIGLSCATRRETPRLPLLHYLCEWALRKYVGIYICCKACTPASATQMVPEPVSASQDTAE